MSKQNPAKRYINSLPLEQSRISMRSLISNAVKIIDANATIETYDWSLLSEDVIVEIRNHLSKKVKGKEKNKGVKLGKAPATVNAYLSGLKGVAKFAKKGGFITKETHDDINEISRVPGNSESKGRALSLKELNTILDHCMSQDGPLSLRDATLIALMYGAGLRRTEATTLLLKDYRDKVGELNIIGKGGKSRTVGLNDRIVDILECWLLERGRWQGALFVRVYKGGTVSKESISAATVYNVIVRRYKESGLEALSPHDLRRSFATHLFNQGEDVFTIQELMGHSSSDTTKVYDKRKKDKNIRASKKLPL